MIPGHTDSKPFRGGNRNYGNWELSADRANAARRALVGDGVAHDRIAKGTGRADNDPLVPEDPESARNRRISIMLLYDESRPVRRFVPEPVTIEPRKDAKAKGKGRGKGGGAAGGKGGYDKNWSGPRLR